MPLRTAVLTMILALVVIVQGCQKTVPLPEPTGRQAYVLASDAHPDDPFCVVNAPDPLLQPHELRLHCTDVKTVRKFVSSLLLAE